MKCGNPCYWSIIHCRILRGFRENLMRIVSRCLLAGLCLLTLLPSLTSAADQPNVLIVMADDCTFSDLPLYGGQNAKTPNIDRLASEGLTFQRAYLCSAMCQPCRAELFTGQYPMRNGCAWNHSASREGTQSLPQHLGKLGYRVGIAGKVHVKPDSAFPFEPVGGFDPNCVRNPTRQHDLTGYREFISRDADQPFCLVIALVEPHVPWVMGDASQYPPQKIKLPSHIADTPRTRQDFGRYLAEITYMDSQVGEILDTLQQAGRDDDTFVLFTSEQGSQFPGCKWTNWDAGVHTALVARWPGRIKAGTQTGALVQYSDVVPTLVEAAGGDPTTGSFDGTSFLSVLTGESTAHREFVYGMHNNVPEGPPYPVRSISDGNWHYLRNLRPDEIYIEKHLMGTKGDGGLNNPYWGTWVWHSQSDPRTYELVKRYTRRPAEQLYHTANDRAEMTNLASRPEHAKIQRRLSEALDKWMAAQGDPGAPQDLLETLQSARQLKHRFVPPDAD